jgi:catechol 2,3-dioxygenase-like lactoylglutathione lyase family enzyme
VADRRGIAPIRALCSVTLTTPVLDEAVRFYTEVWGLHVVAHEDTAAWLRGTGPHHQVLGLRAGQKAGLAQISFALASRDDVDGAAEALGAMGLPLLDEPGPSKEPGGGYALRFCDPEGRVLELVTETEAVDPLPTDQPAPVGVTHIVVNTVDIDGAVAFYQAVLGFRLSDWSEHQMAFLRCNRDHHCIAFNQASWTSVNHVAYEMPSVDLLMRALGRARRRGVAPEWGPGRHGPGGNVFAYFADPSQLVCELTAEVLQIDDGWLPRVWPRTPELSDLWGTAGPPSDQVRAHMAGSPDPGAFANRPDLRAALATWADRRAGSRR